MPDSAISFARETAATLSAPASRPRIYVDAAIYRWRGQVWCHVFSPDIPALHRFMQQLGARREWFQDPDTMRVSWPHYDAPEKRRAAALEAGAIALDRHQTVVMSKLIIGQWFGKPCDPLAGHRARQSPMLPRLEAWLAEELGSSR